MAGRFVERRPPVSPEFAPGTSDALRARVDELHAIRADFPYHFSVGAMQAIAVIDQSRAIALDTHNKIMQSLRGGNGPLDAQAIARSYGESVKPYDELAEGLGRQLIELFREQQTSFTPLGTNVSVSRSEGNLQISVADNSGAVHSRMFPARIADMRFLQDLAKLERIEKIPDIVKARALIDELHAGNLTPRDFAQDAIKLLAQLESQFSQNEPYRERLGLSPQGFDFKFTRAAIMRSRVLLAREFINFTPDQLAEAGARLAIDGEADAFNEALYIRVLNVGQGERKNTFISFVPFGFVGNQEQRAGVRAMIQQAPAN